ncbi:MAG: hypothetical protein EBZ77_07190 [Chitinophagia bacterium]|nr:hypothetical protein [Chitinophagia bacterium]
MAISSKWVGTYQTETGSTGNWNNTGLLQVFLSGKIVLNGVQLQNVSVTNSGSSISWHNSDGTSGNITFLDNSAANRYFDVPQTNKCFTGLYTTNGSSLDFRGVRQNNMVNPGWDGTYKTQTRWGGITGEWSTPFGSLAVNADGSILIDGTALQNVVVATDGASFTWNNPGQHSGNVHFWMGDGTTTNYFFPTPVSGPAFTGVFASYGSGGLDFHGWL